MHIRRFTRLTNALSKKLGNRAAAAVALHFLYYKSDASSDTSDRGGYSSHAWSIVEIAGCATQLTRKRI
jgi:hypothetical protein